MKFLRTFLQVLCGHEVYAPVGYNVIQYMKAIDYTPTYAYLRKRKRK
jgi:hypothetical protein